MARAAGSLASITAAPAGGTRNRTAAASGVVVVVAGAVVAGAVDAGAVVVVDVVVRVCAVVTGGTVGGGAVVLIVLGLDAVGGLGGPLVVASSAVSPSSPAHPAPSRAKATSRPRRRAGIHRRYVPGLGHGRQERPPYEQVIRELAGTAPVLRRDQRAAAHRPSLAFHTTLGFREVGQQDTKGGAIRVSLLALDVS